MIQYRKKFSDASKKSVFISTLSKTNVVYQLSSIEDIKPNMLMIPIEKGIAFVFEVSNIADAKEIINYSKEVDNDITFVLILPTEIYTKLINSNKKTSYEEFKEVAIVLVPDINRKLLYQIFRRTGNDYDKVREILIDKEIRSIKELEKQYPLDKQVFISNIIDPILYKRRGFKLTTWEDDLEFFVKSFSRQYLYKAATKYINELYRDKINTLEQNTNNINEYRKAMLLDMRVNEILMLKLLIIKSNYNRIYLDILRYMKGEQCITVM